MARVPSNESLMKYETDVEQALQQCKKINEQYSYFLNFNDDALTQARQLDRSSKKGKLAGVFISVKDNICVQHLESTAGSRILKGYKPHFDATVVARAREEGAIILGKTTMDEFGFGGFNTNVGLDNPIPKNPHDPLRVTGGSSGGAAGITAKAAFHHVAIAESTGGSIENPAAFCGVIGYCPTYGILSRHGLISYANSLDKIGLMSKKVKDLIPVLDVIVGVDEKDPTSLPAPSFQSAKQQFRIGLIKESLHNVDPAVKAVMVKTMASLKKGGHTIEDVSLPLTFKYGLATYYILACCEASTNLACLCGLRYGQETAVAGKSFHDYFTQIRSLHFNLESKRRIMLGTFARSAGYRDAYYLKATKVRTQIIEEYKQLFQRYDLLISPTMPVVAPLLSEIKKMAPLQQYQMDQLTVGPNVAGIPHASVPCGRVGKMPVGLLVMANHLQDASVLRFLQLVENL